MREETRAVHEGGRPRPGSASGDIAAPMHLSTTFEHAPDGELVHGFMYARWSSPETERLEATLAALDGGEAALTFGSGMAAVSAFLQTLPEGAHVIFHKDLYFDVLAIGRELLPRWGMSADVIDVADAAALAQALETKTALVWIETPTNPQMQVIDIEAVARQAHAAGAKLIVDGTFATPVLQKPIALGADYVMHSATKYMGGHSDVQGGVIVFTEEAAGYEALRSHRKMTGPVLAPFNAWLISRGIKSMFCRVDRQSKNAFMVAGTLEGHARIDAVHYPGLESHPGHEIAARQMRLFGAMMSIIVAGGASGALAFAGRLKLVTNATSLGGTETLIEHRPSIEPATSLTPKGLLRISIGLEHPDDIIEDILQALDG